MIQRFFAAALAACMLGAPIAASAQDVPSYAEASGVERIQGRISSFDGAYALRVRDERGYIDDVRIHPGTIINPTGITLAPGMVVSIIGNNAGDYFSGDEVDTPYTIYGGTPYYGGQPWTYFGSGVALGFFFGSLPWWHGDYFGNYGYGWHGGYRSYYIPNYRYRGWWHGRIGGGYYRPYGGPGYGRPAYGPGFGRPGYGPGRGWNGGGYHHAGYNGGPTYVNNVNTHTSVNIINGGRPGYGATGYTRGAYRERPGFAHASYRGGEPSFRDTHAVRTDGFAGRVFNGPRGGERFAGPRGGRFDGPRGGAPQGGGPRGGEHFGGGRGGEHHGGGDRGFGPR